MSRRTMLATDLRERHVNMMAFSACIGFGLFLQSGIVIHLAGPGLAIICFLLACSLMWSVIACLGEMTALFPIQGPIFEFPGRFLDEAVGYAAGWTSWFAWIVTMSAEIMVVSQLFRFEFDPEYLREVGYPKDELKWSTNGDSPAVWIFIFFLIIGALNMLPVRQYAEIEYWFGLMKMLFISGLILFNVILSAMQLVPHDSHFWTWNKPYGFSSPAFPLAVDENLQTTKSIDGGPGTFISLWTGTSSVIFSLIGFETIAISGAENKDLEKYETIKIASKKLFIRITLLYTLAMFSGGLNVPQNDRYLIEAAFSSVRGGQNSLFVLAAVRNRLVGWPNFFNGFFIFSACASGINCLYNSSRLLHALASIPEAWPLWAQSWRRRLERTSSRGVPYATIFVSWMFGLLSFLAIGGEPSKILGRMSTNATVSELLVYATICASYIRFYHKIKSAAEDHNLENRAAFNRDDEQYPYRTHLQLARTYYGLIFCILIILFNGWRSFLEPFAYEDFIVSYIGIVAFFLLVALYHIKTDGLNPFSWRLSSSMQIQRPPPKVVVPGRRRGVLDLPNKKKTFAEENVQSFVDWLWVWLK